MSTVMPARPMPAGNPVTLPRTRVPRGSRRRAALSSSSAIATIVACLGPSAYGNPARWDVGPYADLPLIGRLCLSFGVERVLSSVS